MIETLGYGTWAPDAANYPNTVAWYDRVCARDAWRKVADEEAAVFARLGGCAASGSAGCAASASGSGTSMRSHRFYR